MTYHVLLGWPRLLAFVPLDVHYNIEMDGLRPLPGDKSSWGISVAFLLTAPVAPDSLLMRQTPLSVHTP